MTEPAVVEGAPLGLFQGFGVELEYMIVDAESLDVRPISDRLLEDEAGAVTTEVERGPMAWSNELALHVIEFKTAGPASALDGLSDAFHGEVTRALGHLQRHGARLMPTAMHPWMDPHREMALWPHEYNAVYEAFNRIFDCRGHGWANLQSAHLNLPFADDGEFARLHAAIRLALPLIPALAASSPVVDGRATGLLDSRLDAYRHNCDRIPSLVGAVIPEPVWTPAAYREALLAGLYRDLEPHDPAGTLQDEWVNARGAIARFQRNTIEIRLIDVQECPSADLAVLGATVALLRALTEERWSDLSRQQRLPTARLSRLLDATIISAEAAVLDDAEYLVALGWDARHGSAPTAGEVWRTLVERCVSDGDQALGPAVDTLERLLVDGTLARRILRALGDDPSRARLRGVYEALCQSLDEDDPFLG